MIGTALTVAGSIVQVAGIALDIYALINGIGGAGSSPGMQVEIAGGGIIAGAGAQAGTIVGAGSLIGAMLGEGLSSLGEDLKDVADESEEVHREELSEVEDGEVQIKAGDKTPKGREYTQHAAERANERGFDSQKIDSIIDNNYKHRTKEINQKTGKITWRYQDKRGNTVVTDEWGDKIVTVYSHPASLNDTNYIPKG